MKKICVYTCITGNYDIVNEINNKEKDIDYYMFTNNKNIKSKTWNIVYINNNKLDNQRLSRKIKMLGHKSINNKYDYYVWMDASVIWKKSIRKFVNQNIKNNNFAAFKHAYRNCIYEEAKECIKLRKDSKENILKHIEYLKKEKYPENNGLYEMTVFIRKNNDPLVEKTMKQWFDMVCNYSKRDQLSFMFCVYKNNLKIDTIPGNVWNNDWFTHSRHNNTKQVTDFRVYYGDSNLNPYDINIDYLYPCKIENNTYSINTIIPIDTEIIEVEITNVACVTYDNLYTSLKTDKVFIFNTIPYNDKNIFYNDQGIIRFEGNFKKGDNLKIKIDLDYLSESQKNIFIDKLSTDLIIASEEIEKLTAAINEKLTTKIKRIIKSIFNKKKL